MPWTGRQTNQEVIMPITQMLLPEVDQEMAKTRQVLERVPEDRGDYRPHARSMTLGRLARHLAEIPAWGVRALTLESFEIPATRGPAAVMTSRKELLETFDANVGTMRQALAGASDEALGVEWALTHGGKAVFKLPRFAVLRAMMISHMVHHRAQLGVYLRLLDVPIPGMYGPSADEG
jgi:uncharacterized damage-inducible protein DinB